MDTAVKTFTVYFQRLVSGADLQAIIKDLADPNQSDLYMEEVCADGIVCGRRSCDVRRNIKVRDQYARPIELNKTDYSVLTITAEPWKSGCPCTDRTVAASMAVLNAEDVDFVHHFFGFAEALRIAVDHSVREV